MQLYAAWTYREAVFLREQRRAPSGAVALHPVRRQTWGGFEVSYREAIFLICRARIC